MRPSRHEVRVTLSNTCDLEISLLFKSADNFDIDEVWAHCWNCRMKQTLRTPVPMPLYEALSESSHIDIDHAIEMALNEHIAASIGDRSYMLDHSDHVQAA